MCNLILSLLQGAIPTTSSSSEMQHHVYKMSVHMRLSPEFLLRANHVDILCLLTFQTLRRKLDFHYSLCLWKLSRQTGTVGIALSLRKHFKSQVLQVTHLDIRSLPTLPRTTLQALTLEFAILKPMLPVSTVVGIPAEPQASQVTFLLILVHWV